MKKQTKLYLVRHGEVHNPENILYGRLPGYRLSETGVSQAHAMGKHLKNVPFRTVYASPLQRAQETASIISSYHEKLTIVPDERLLEIKTPLEGTSNAELDKTRFNFYERHTLRAGGESIDDIFARMQRLILDVHLKHTGEDVLAVSHGDPIMITKTFYSGLPLFFESIRGDHYIKTAHGIVLTITDDEVTVDDVVPDSV